MGRHAGGIARESALQSGLEAGCFATFLGLDVRNGLWSGVRVARNHDVKERGVLQTHDLEEP